jgi:hypothetical protein
MTRLPGLVPACAASALWPKPPCGTKGLRTGQPHIFVRYNAGRATIRRPAPSPAVARKECGAALARKTPAAASGIRDRRPARRTSRRTRPSARKADRLGRPNGQPDFSPTPHPANSVAPSLFPPSPVGREAVCDTNEKVRWPVPAQAGNLFEPRTTGALRKAEKFALANFGTGEPLYEARELKSNNRDPQGTRLVKARFVVMARNRFIPTHRQSAYTP